MSIKPRLVFEGFLPKIQADFQVKMQAKHKLNLRRKIAGMKIGVGHQCGMHHLVLLARDGLDTPPVM